MVQKVVDMNNASKHRLGKNLRAIRKKLSLTISEVSKLTGLASSTSSKVENDYRSILRVSSNRTAAGDRPRRTRRSFCVSAARGG
jgi:DNA-binding XRE family transcriptional regulator